MSVKQHLIKDSLTVVHLLAYPDPNKPYVLYTDASDTCIGACFTQAVEGEYFKINGVKTEKPIYFLSHKLSPTQVKWSTVEKEAYAIHYALQKLDHYLHNAEFVILTDHRPLRYILDGPVTNKKLQLWALGIAGYNCKVEYIAGTANSCADLLSRIPTKSDENNHVQETDDDVDFDDKAYEVGTLNSNSFDSRRYASCHLDEDNDLVKPDIDLPGEFSMEAEQAEDEIIASLKKRLQSGTAT
ncbi:Hypothetical predicted protein [Mytilus galloprovincialis]|uniref:Reverse transcriptase RNase H-like domain-containing protein n=1 Tax=Mytilus galloprovincialis TaxID=29158 RepID=A0A8B6EM97_MYTGA|nr:Hypothetical predicted protein [Mytilus galloprovincialis]